MLLTEGTAISFRSYAFPLLSLTIISGLLLFIFLSIYIA